MLPQGEVAILIEQFLARSGSDLYICAGSKPTMRQGNTLITLDEAPITPEAVHEGIRACLPAKDVETFTQTHELNTAIDWGKEARLRINVFQQQQKPGMVIRRISNRIPSLDELRLPPLYAQLALEKRGLVIIAGPSHAGKSSTFAAMVGHRNAHGSGHILTIEDPVELIHTPQNCIVSQREVGIDTNSLSDALKFAARQGADMIAIAELRDAASIEQAISLAEMGHLVLTTLAAGNAAQVFEQILLLFPKEAHVALQARLSQALRAVLVQRLLVGPRNKPVVICETLINEGLSRNLIRESKFRELREYMENHTHAGMQSFDQSLAQLVQQGEISEELAINEADNATNMKIRFRQATGNMTASSAPRTSTF